MQIIIQRAYEAPAEGYRALVDRLWPRGVKKEVLALNEWCKDVAPSTELREWFDHDPTKFEEFTARYQDELKHSDAPQKLLDRAKGSTMLILVYGAKDPTINHAVVLRDYLNKMLN